MILEFGSSRSSRYPEAVALARSLPGYSPPDPTSGDLHRVPVPLDARGRPTSPRAERLAELVGGWRSSRLVDPEGRETTLQDLARAAEERQEARERERFRRAALSAPTLADPGWVRNPALWKRFGPPWVPILGLERNRRALLAVLGPHVRRGLSALLVDATLVREPGRAGPEGGLRVDLGETAVGTVHPREAGPYARVMDRLGLETVGMAAVFRQHPAHPEVWLGHLWPEQLRTPGPRPAEVWDDEELERLRSWYAGTYDWPPVWEMQAPGSGPSGCGGRAAALVAALAGWLGGA